CAPRSSRYSEASPARSRSRRTVGAVVVAGLVEHGALAVQVAHRRPLPRRWRAGRSSHHYMTDTIRVSRPDLLTFFDVAPPGSRKHATPIVAVAGEELGLALLADHLRRKGRQAVVLYDQSSLLQRCTPGTKSGRR